MTVAKHPLPAELIDSLLSGYKKPEDLIGEDGLLKQLPLCMASKPRFSIKPSNETLPAFQRPSAFSFPKSRKRNWSQIVTGFCQTARSATIE